MIKELREATGAGVLDCRKTLEAVDGNYEKAIEQLRKKGLAEAAKKSNRAASDGCIEAYVHHGDRIGVMLELNCETDFVARTDEFKELAHELALHIAFAAPDYLTREEVPGEILEAEKAIYREQALEEDKPEHIVERIVEGRMDKFYEQECLMEQPFVKDNDITIQDLINNAVLTLGENIVLGRFARYEIGEATQ